MASDPVTAVGNALSGFFGLLKPSIDEAYAQKYNDQHKERMEKFQEIMGQPDSDLRAARLAQFIIGMCNDAGTPAGILQGELVSIPVEVFQALVINLSESIKSDQLLGRITFKTG